MCVKILFISVNELSLNIYFLVSFICAASLQGVILWASKDPEERRKWLPVLCQKIDLSLLDSQTRLKYIATLEDRQLLTDDLKYIIAPIDVNSDTAEEGSDDQEETVKKTRYNSQEEVGSMIIFNLILFQTHYQE